MFSSAIENDLAGLPVRLAKIELDVVGHLDQAVCRRRMSEAVYCNVIAVALLGLACCGEGSIAISCFGDFKDTRIRESQWKSAQHCVTCAFQEQWIFSRQFIDSVVHPIFAHHLHYSVGDRRELDIRIATRHRFVTDDVIAPVEYWLKSDE